MRFHRFKTFNEIKIVKNKETNGRKDSGFRLKFNAHLSDNNREDGS